MQKLRKRTKQLLAALGHSKYRILKEELSKRFGWICWYCGARLVPFGGQIDHIIALGSGGGHEFKNLALACEYCNRAKFALPLEQFMGWIAWLRSGNSFTPFDMSVIEVKDAEYKARDGDKELPKLREEI